MLHKENMVKSFFLMDYHTQLKGIHYIYIYGCLKNMDKSQKHDFKNILFIFRERGREEERERNIHQSGASCTPPTGDLAQNPGMCPDQESTDDP